MKELHLQGLWEEAARKMAEIVDDDTFRSLEGKSKHQLWLELCDLITKHPREVASLRVDAILRSGIRKFTDEVPVFNCYSRMLLLQPRMRQCLPRMGSTLQDPIKACCAARRWAGCGRRWRTSTSGRACTSARATCTRRA